MPGAVSSTNSRRKAAAKALRSRPITTQSACGAHCSWAQHPPTRVRRSHSLHVRRLSSRSSLSGSGTSTATRAKPRRPGGALALRRRRPGAGAPPVRLVGPRAVRPGTAVPVVVILPRELAQSVLFAFLAERVAPGGSAGGDSVLRCSRNVSYAGLVVVRLLNVQEAPCFRLTPFYPQAASASVWRIC